MPGTKKCQLPPEATGNIGYKSMAITELLDKRTEIVVEYVPKEQT